MRERGSALLTSVVVIMVLMLITGVFFSMVISQMKLETSEEKALKAYYLAEAGVNYEVAAVINDRNLLQNTDVQFPDPFGPDYGGEFTVKWVDDGNTYSFTVTSSGTYQGITRTLSEQYKYPTVP